MNKLSSEKIIQNISKRKVTLLLGEEDVTNSALTTYLLCDASWKTSV